MFCCHTGRSMVPANSRGKHHSRYFVDQTAIKIEGNIKRDCFYENGMKHRDRWRSNLGEHDYDLCHLILKEMKHVTQSRSRESPHWDNPLPEIGCGAANAEVKSISSHPLHRKLQMTCCGRLESVAWKSGGSFLFPKRRSLSIRNRKVWLPVWLPVGQ